MLMVAPPRFAGVLRIERFMLTDGPFDHNPAKIDDAALEADLRRLPQEQVQNLAIRTDADGRYDLRVVQDDLGKRYVIFDDAQRADLQEWNQAQQPGHALDAQAVQDRFFERAVPTDVEYSISKGQLRYVGLDVQA